MLYTEQERPENNLCTCGKLAERCAEYAREHPAHFDVAAIHEVALKHAHEAQRPLTELRAYYLGDGIFLPLISHTHNLPAGIDAAY